MAIMACGFAFRRTALSCEKRFLIMTVCSPVLVPRFAAKSGFHNQIGARHRFGYSHLFSFGRDYGGGNQMSLGGKFRVRNPRRSIAYSNQISGYKD